MARLPDNTPSGSSFWDGAQDSWLDDNAERMAATSVWNVGTTPFDEQQQYAIDALRQAEADAAYLTRVQETRHAAAAAGNVDDLKMIESNWQATNAARAAAFADPRFGAQWSAERDIETGAAIATRRAEVTGQQWVDKVNAWLDGLQTSALRAGGDDTAQLIDTGARLIQGLTGAGHIDQSTAQAMRRHWVQNYAKAWIEMRPAKERLALLGDAPTQGEGGTDSGSAERGTANEVTHRTGTVADFLPSEDRERIQREAQVELDRNTTQQTWQKTDQYERSMAEASRGDPKPPPWRAAIEADPDLDDLTRTRLLKQHDAMQRKLDAFWLAKAEYDRPNGRKFDVNDARDRDFVEQIYTRLGADTAALHAVVNRTGMMPDAALDAMKGALSSKEPASVVQAIKDLGRLKHNFLTLLVLGGNEAERLQNDLTEFRYYSQGRTPDQAAKQFMYARSPEGEAERIPKLKNIDIDAVIARATSMSGLERVFGGNPAVTKAVIAEYRDLLRERLVATADPDLARKQANDQMKPLLDAAAEDLAEKDAAGRPSWVERAWFNGLDGFYRHTLVGAGQLRNLADMARAVEADPTAREKLLNRFFPGLRNSKWEENREAKWQEIKTAPERLRKINADLKRYDEMKGFDSASEFGAAAAGQIVASLLSPESYVGWSVKGASWGVRAMKAALQQAGIASAADLGVQWNLVKAGAQDKIDLSQTAGAAAGGAVVGSAVGAVTPPTGNAKSGHVGITPEGPPQHPTSSLDVNVEESVPVTSRPGTQDVAQEVTNSSASKSEELPNSPTSEAQTLAPPGMPATSQFLGQPESVASGLPNPQTLPTAKSEEPPLLAPGLNALTPAPDGAFGPPAARSNEAAPNAPQIRTENPSSTPTTSKADGQPSVRSDGRTLDTSLASFGEAETMSYRVNFFRRYPDLEGEDLWVHHATEQKWARNDPPTITWSKMHSAENLRGIPKTKNNDVHLRGIRIEMNRFKRKYPNPTEEQLLVQANYIDDMFGEHFLPPRGRR